MNHADVARQKDFIRGREPRILYLDLEISPMVALTFSAYEANAFAVKIPPMIISFAYQWEGEKTVHVKTVFEYKGYKPGIFNLNDKLIVSDLYDVMEQADVIVGHNIKKFDIRHAKTRFYAHGLQPPQKWILEDTLFIARKYFMFPKNNLDYLAEFDGDDGKTKLKYSDLIHGCLEGNARDWYLLGKYNAQDVVITRKRYLKLRGWHETHYNLNLIRRKGNNCPTCGSNDYKLNGHRYWKGTIGQRYKCLNMTCGVTWTGEKIASFRDNTTELINQSR